MHQIQKQKPKTKTMTYGDGNAIMIIAADRMGLSPALLDEAIKQLKGESIHPMTAAAIEKEACRMNDLVRQDDVLLAKANSHAQALKVEYGFSERALEYFIADNAPTPHLGIGAQGIDGEVYATWPLPESEEERDSLELLVMGAVAVANVSKDRSVVSLLTRAATHCATRSDQAMTALQQQVHDGLIAAAALKA